MENEEVRGIGWRDRRVKVIALKAANPFHPQHHLVSEAPPEMTHEHCCVWSKKLTPPRKKSKEKKRN